MKKHLTSINILLLCAASVLLFGFELRLAGWTVLAAGLACLFLIPKTAAKNLLLVYIGIAALGLTPIKADTHPVPFLIMTVGLGLAVFGLYLIERYVYHNQIITFRLFGDRGWDRLEVVYIISITIAAYLLLPFYLRSTGSYLNWSFDAGMMGLLMGFVGLFAVGIWDELFFVSTVLGIFSRHVPFYLANLAQAVIFASCLYALGFHGWGVGAIFAFALAQGYIFKRSGALAQVIAIHLSIDIILYLVLINLHNPAWVQIFIT